MNQSPSQSPSESDRRARDRRIRELRADGWSLSEIALEVGLSRERVRQVLAEAVPVDRSSVGLADRVAALAAELDELLRRREANRRRIRVIQRALDRIAEEQEAASIDRLLGLG